ncbi:formate dehydrogenase subunit delta [Amorphus sp. 3PC139-8]|uniref:formate dehydrogenase subunit delta n=1 Tax=Amorphus sp. 3PC139-8 TaxID=2735676 RepID=UPI00345C95CB
METADLTRMANQIADYFTAYGHDEAVAGIADHIEKFWDPRMRKTLLAHVANGGDGLDPLVLEAAERLAPVTS